MTPEMFTNGSGEHVWWICEKGHEWKASIASRAKGAGCPYCSGFKWKSGEKDLLTLYPDIAKEWDYEKNNPLTPDQINAGSRKKVWWICPLGHSYESSILNRTNPTNHCGCPYCSNKKVFKGYNDLESVFPLIAKEWDYEKNTPLKPSDVVFGSHIKAWWICPIGHSYESKIVYRTNPISHSGCPYCANKKVLKGFNDLESQFPLIAKEWDYKENKPLKPSDVVYGSNKEVWWICRKCGNNYKKKIVQRTRNNSKCPNCKK